MSEVAQKDRDTGRRPVKPTDRMSVPHDAALMAAVRKAGLDTVEGAFAWRGEDIDKPGLGSRRRTRVTLTDEAGREHVLYLKRYGTPGAVRAGEVWAAVKRWLATGRRCSAAEAEWRNIEAAAAAGVPTMRPLARGSVPCPIGAAASFLLVTAVPGEALARCAGRYLSAGGAEAGEALAAGLARLAKRLHDAGWVHRDLYTSHVFLDERAGGAKLYLIDLARLLRPRLRELRWYVKDVAQLKYSMPAAWAAEHWATFLRHYLTGVSSDAQRRFDRKVDRKVARMRRRNKR